MFGKKVGEIELFLSRERNALAEERTILAYIRTELALVGVIAIAFRFFLDQFKWSVPVTILLIILGGIVIFLESVKIKKLREKRHKLQKEYKRLR